MSRAAWLTIAAMLIVTVCVYAPSLYGGYFFDDGYYFVDNVDVHITSLDLASITRAALSQAGANQFRALGMLTFALNFYFTGLDPFWVKLTNLVIHLSNGLLLFFLLRELFRLRQVVRANMPDDSLVSIDFNLAAAVIAGCWLILPINLTAVAYVSQRLESLANLFVFWGLLWYLRARQREYESGQGGASLFASLAICTFLGLCTKESAVMLPLYAVCIEFALTGFRNRTGSFSVGAITTHIIVLVIPLIAGLIWISHWNFASVGNLRTFTIAERLLTEPRILIDYMRWTLFPNLDQLSFYHDDIALSQSLTDPPTTWIAIAALAALLVVAFLQRARRPLFCLGIIWFFAGHILTGTIIPLELVFEHRNYFASVGLLLAFAAIIGLEPLWSTINVRPGAACGFVIFFALTTLVRAEEWSHPLRLALSEASRRPDSVRAQYSLARALIVAAGTDQSSPLLKEARSVLEKSAFKPNSGISGLQALIYLDCRANGTVAPDRWEKLIENLRKQPPSQTDIGALEFLLHTQLRGECPMQKQELLNAFTAALDRSDGDVNLMTAYADFAYLELGDPELAGRILREVVVRKPTVAIYRANLIDFLIASGRLEEAEEELRQLRSLNYYGSLNGVLAKLSTEIEQARVDAHASPSPVPLSADGVKP